MGQSGHHMDQTSHMVSWAPQEEIPEHSDESPRTLLVWFKNKNEKDKLLSKNKEWQNLRKHLIFERRKYLERKMGCENEWEKMQ